MKGLIKKISATVVAVVMATTTMITANAVECEHDSIEFIRSEIVAVNNDYYHYPHIQGAQVTCHVRDCVVNYYYRCNFCQCTITVTNPHVFYHSVIHS